MSAETIVFDHHGADGFQPYLECYPLAEAGDGTAVLICPGGGYRQRAPHEGEPIARAFNALGLHAFVLHYRVAPDCYPAGLQDAARAIAEVRSRADRWGVAPDRLAVCGFSAGGHLTASLGARWNHPDLDLPGPAEQYRPNALILCYSVLTWLPEETHGSAQCLYGRELTDAQQKAFALDTQVTTQMPPCFLWHTLEDSVVSFEHSIRFLDALRAVDIPAECHLYQHGAHGVGLGRGSRAEEWPARAIDWLRGIFSSRP